MLTLMKMRHSSPGIIRERVENKVTRARGEANKDIDQFRDHLSSLLVVSRNNYDENCGIITASLASLSSFSCLSVAVCSHNTSLFGLVQHSINRVKIQQQRHTG